MKSTPRSSPSPTVQPTENPTIAPQAKKPLARAKRSRPTFTCYAPAQESRDGKPLCVSNSGEVDAREVTAIRVNTGNALYALWVQSGKLCVRAIETPISPKRALVISPVTPFDVQLIPLGDD